MCLVGPTFARAVSPATKVELQETIVIRGRVPCTSVPLQAQKLIPPLPASKPKPIPLHITLPHAHTPKPPTPAIPPSHTAATPHHLWIKSTLHNIANIPITTSKLLPRLGIRPLHSISVAPVVPILLLVIPSPVYQAPYAPRLAPAARRFLGAFAFLENLRTIVPCGIGVGIRIFQRIISRSSRCNPSISISISIGNRLQLVHFSNNSSSSPSDGTGPIKTLPSAVGVRIILLGLSRATREIEIEIEIVIVIGIGIGIESVLIFRLLHGDEGIGSENVKGGGCVLDHGWHPGRERGER
ncbi:hypothetical protein Fmac_011447 [Flemingia macrophylla]|uniref:Uncharacterized protein n=1 Tax=Flemingia macrophylla TaxID=520843 RepID=A0ABD1MMH1_9FABA